VQIERLYTILNECSAQFRKGAEIEGDPQLVEAIKRGDRELPGGVASFYMMPSVTDATDNLVKVDCHFIVVGVDKDKANERRQDLIDILNEYPNPERLKGGPSYIEVGAEVGDQGMAFKLFAVGQVLGFWDIITPARMGITGPMADQMAGQGFVMITGFNPDAQNS